jgi:hypothetical protein
MAEYELVVARRVTLVCAPDIPPDELTVLEGLCASSLDDVRIPTVVNYPVSVQNLIVGYSPLLVTAPDIPPATLDELRKKLNDPTIKLIVVNYNVTVQEF